MADDKSLDHARAVRCPCPDCGRVNVPLRDEPDIRYCMECGTDVTVAHDCGDLYEREQNTERIDTRP